MPQELIANMLGARSQIEPSQDGTSIPKRDYQNNLPLGNRSNAHCAKFRGVTAAIPMISIAFISR
jgi:hypothetical protein